QTVRCGGVRRGERLLGGAAWFGDDNRFRIAERFVRWQAAGYQSQLVECSDQLYGRSSLAAPSRKSDYTPQEGRPRSTACTGSLAKSLLQSTRIKRFRTRFLEFSVAGRLSRSCNESSTWSRFHEHSCLHITRRTNPMAHSGSR